MKKPLSTGISILFVLFFLTCAQIDFASSVTVGVSKGDTFTYDSSYLWSSTDSSKPLPADALEASQIVEIQIVVTSVSGSLVNATKTYRFQNGTEQSVSGYADVATGDNEEVGAFFFVSSNLNVDDTVYPEGFYGYTINKTLQRTYANSERETLLDSSTFNFEYTTTVNGNPATRVLNSQIDYYFDKTTGVCLEQREQTKITDPATNQSETTTSLITLVQTNLWPKQEFPTLIVAVTPLIMAVLIAALAFVLHKRKSGPKKSSELSG